MSGEPPDTPSRRPSPALILLVPLVVALAVTLFAWPTARLEPRDLPVGVAGPPAAAMELEAELGSREGAFEVHRYADEAAARQAIEDREVYGAFVLTPAGQKVLTASGASAAVARQLSEAARSMGESSGQAAPVDDVAPSPRDSALASSVLPLVIAGIVTGVMAGMLIPGTAVRRAGLLVIGSILAGLAATAIVQSWLDVVRGDWLVNAGALSLTVLAIASVIAGLYGLLGERGLILAAVTMVLVGNPFSGVATAPELLPEPAGVIGQLLPPGAGGNLLRSTGFFDGGGAGEHLTVLAGWALVGLVALFAAGARSRRRSVAAPLPAS